MTGSERLTSGLEAGVREAKDKAHFSHPRASSRKTEEERHCELRSGCGGNYARKHRVWIYSDELGHCRTRTYRRRWTCP